MDKTVCDQNARAECNLFSMRRITQPYILEHYEEEFELIKSGVKYGQ